MAKQLNVNLSFNADTKQAKAEIEALSKALQTIAKMPGNASSLFDDTEIKKASQAALELQQHLSKAVNTDTGKLDLSRFSSSLKASNKDLNTYCNTLLKTGQQGQQAFLQLAKAIASADTPVTRVNKKLAEMGTTLKNTARWQISSSILHGFMGSIQSAYGYAQDLNESLNNIRIVTGQNIEQMSKFAVEANRAAKALSTTTTDYTDASLIYFQQGLSSEEVAKRTEVTIKMANAAGQSAQVVSDQLTAVWNNFYDGTKSLEYYADVMTALGAATASSTDEIAGGLEKFAAIGKTIGLSYEYAASALATITANTRQSEDVVGTALKTIFARIQGLNLGETLDDGTTLNKYSEALNKVGISIFEQNGEIKKMDDILDEMGSKWGTLAKDQQIALAQTVAGVRQYTQLVALMDNWDAGDSDSMTANLNTSYNASGTLQKQADIYAESWEAAQNRVRAAAENIYDSLINDEFFIDLLNGFEKVLETVGGLVDGLGGLKGVIGVIGSVFLTNFAQKMPATLENLRQNVMVFTGQAQKEMIKVQDQMSAKMAEQAAAPGVSESYKTQAEAILQVSKMKQKLILESKNLTSQEKEAYEARIKNVEAMYDEAIALAQVVEEQKKKAQTSADSLAKNASKDIESLYSNRDQSGDQRDSAERIRAAAEKDGNNVEKERQAQAIKEAEAAMDDYSAKIKDAIDAYKALGVEIVKTNEKGEEVFDTSKSKEMAAAVKKVTDEYKQQITQWKQLEVLQDDMSGQVEHWKQNAEEIDKSEEAVKDLKVTMAGYRDAITTIAAQNEIAFDETELQALNAALQDPKTSAVDCAAAFEKFKQSIDEKLTSKMSSLNDSIEESSDTLERLGLSTTGLGAMKNSAEEAAEGVTKLALSTGNIKGQVDQGIDSTFEMSVALTEFGATVMSVSGMFESITSAIDVFKDESATGFEKLGAAISIVTSGMAAFNAVQALSTTLTKSDLTAKIAAAFGYKMVKTESGALTLVKMGETGAVNANTAAWYANPIMWIALIIVGVIAALAALVAVIGAVSKALADAYNADAIAAEKAEASARALSEAYNEAKQSYEDMIAAMDEYKSARESLDSLTEGTKEYQEALEQANRAALELINNNPDLFKEGDYHWENGELIINDDAMARAQQTASARESQAYAAMQMGQAEAKEARNVADETALRRELIKDSTTAEEHLTGALAGALGTIISGVIAGPAGLAMGGTLAGTTGSFFTSAIESKKLEDSGAIDKVLEQLQKNSTFLDQDADEIKATLNIEDDDIINALIENKDALIKLSESQEAQARQEQLAAQQSAMEIMRNAGYDNADEMAYTAGAAFQKANEQAYDALLKSMSNKSGLKSAAAAYFDSQGISSKTGFKVDKYDAKNGTVSYSYIDESGKRQELEVSAEQIAMTQAVIEAQGELLNSCESITSTFDILDKDIQNVNSSTAALSEGMKEFLSTGDTGQLTKEQYDAMNGMSNDELVSYLESIGINESNISDFGYEDVAALIADMDLASTGDKWAEYQNITAHQGTENLTLNQAENINNALADIADFFGEEVGHEMLDLSAAMADSLDEAAQDEFWQQLGNISDYTDAAAWDEFLEAMKESGDLTEDQIEALEDYVDTAKLAARATKDISFEEMAESIRSLRDIMEGITEEGKREFTDEEVASLEAAGVDISNFAKTIDGYRYLGDSSELAAQIGEDIANSFREVRQNFDNIVDQAAQARQNMIDAQNNLDSVREGSAAVSSAVNSANGETISNIEIFKNILADIKGKIMIKLQEAANNIAAFFTGVYDNFVSWYNSWGQKWHDFWDSLLSLLEEGINGLLEGLFELMEDVGLIDDADDYKVDFTSDTDEFVPMKSSEELAAEAELAKSEKELIAANQQIIDATPDLLNSIEASADYMSASELQADKAQVESELDYARGEYAKYVDLYGPDSPLAQSYADLIKSYEAQLKSYDKALESKEWGEMLGEGIDLREFETYVELLEDAHPEMRQLYKDTESYEKALLLVAAANKKMEKGVKTLSSNWDNWNEIMGDSTSSAEDIATVLPGINDALQDVLNLDTEQFALLPPDFARKHWDLIQDVVNGVEGSVDTLRDMAGQEILMTIDGVVDPDGNIDAEFLALHEKIAAFDQSQFTVGVAIDHDDHADFIAACNDIIQKAGMTAEQAQAYFASMGYDVKLKTVEQPVSEVVWNHIYRNVYDDRGNLAGKVIERAWPQTFTGVTEAVAIETITPNGSYGGGIGVNTTPPKTSTPKSSSSGGGGSKSKEKEASKPETIDKTKKNEVVERYKEVNDALDDLSDEYEKASRSADRLWGEHRLDALREQNELIKEQQELLAEKQKQAKKYMQQDKAALQTAAAAAGLAFSFDENGNITNYTDQMSALYEQLAAAEDHYNSLSTGEDQDAYEETILEPLRKKIASVEDAMALYEESKELFEELGLEIDDLQDQIMQNNYDIIMDGLELHIGFNEEDLEVIDYYLSKIEDDFYKMHEAAALMMGENGSQLAEYKQNLEEYTAAMNELNRAYAAGEITEAMYEEGMAEVRAGIMDNLSSLNELDKTMMNYYGDTIAMAQEELAKYTDQMDHHVAILEHYQNLMSILGKETDFNALGIILEGQAKTAENALKVSKENYEMYKRQVEAIEQQIAEATTEEAKALLQKEWEAANTAMQEAQQDMLDKTEVWAEALRAILENKLSGFAQDLENALTGGTSFDTLTTSMERAASLQEEYLTTTNQIYETNKLMRTAQQAIDASTSSIAKNRLKQFINETKQLQDQNKLSQYELEIQQAKYNLLLAEMALEDARDAKTVVRLKRDNEGNLGYVYTADQDKLAEAQQELEDAQNSLYNIGLEGANNYSEKYQQTMSEMYDTFTELQEQYLNGEFETEAEYQDAMLKAKEYYYEKLKNYSSLHQVAITTDSRVIADAWSSDYSEMIFNTEDWMRAVTEYVGNVNLAFDEWEANVETITNETLGPNLDTLEDNVKDITDANDALTESIVKDGGVIDAIESELDQVSELTGKYANLRQQIQGLIADHETLMVRIGNEPNPYTPPGTGTSGSSSSSGRGSGSSNSGGSSSGSGQGSSTASTSSGTGTSEANAPDYSDTTKQGVALAIWNGGFGWGNGTTRRNRLDEKGFDPDEIQRIVDATNPNGNWRDRYGISDLNKYSYSSFDTGGYTGAWGSYGKFAMLHEKELVLNPGETENFLASMEVLRSIIKMIDLQSTASQLGGLLHSPGYLAPNTSDTLEQNVHIEASFPEVHDRYEIEAALTSIVNRASQFANRK